MKTSFSAPKVKLETPEVLKIEECQKLLEVDGLVYLSLDFEDPDSWVLQRLSSALGCPHPHNVSGEILWNVRPEVLPGQGARSQTALSFPLHTDCSFEDPTPRFIGLHVLRQDRLGGGRSLLADGRKALQRLEPRYRQALSQDYIFGVPEEFHKGVSSRRLPIVTGDKLRYRREILDETACSPEQLKALNQFEELLTDGTHQMVLEDSTILLLDNCRFLHGRTEVVDPQRYLRRVRFHEKR
jgi:alpha-ketoglutarate-dependent taurine dioxygenase